MPNDRNRNDDLDDITGRRHQIISPRDPQSGLPTGVRATEATEATEVTSATDMTYGDIEFDVVSPTLGDTATHEVGHVVGAGRGQDIEVENDETHLDERSDGPRHVRGVIQKRAPGSGEDRVDASTPKLAHAAASGDYEEIAFAVADDPQAMDFTYQKIETVHGDDADFDGNGPATALTDDQPDDL